MTLPWHLYLFAALFFGAGINHFRSPKVYLKIIPPFFKNPVLLNKISGAAEIILGIFLCIPKFSGYAAWGIVLLLIAVFPANIYMYQKESASLGLTKWMRFIRLPLQFLFIFWTYQYTTIN